jgi:hypothetical protein
MTRCPLNDQQIDNNVARLNAFWSLVLLVAGVFWPPLLWFLLVDFALRAFKRPWSPLAQINRGLLDALQIAPSPVDLPAKIFAERLRLAFTAIAVLLQALQWQQGLILFVLAFTIPLILEGVMAFCVGCRVYSLINKNQQKEGFAPSESQATQQ